MRSMTSPARGRGQTVPPRTDLGRLIRLARESHDPKITQEELADKVGIRQSQLSKIERGETERPMKETIRLIAEALDVNPDPLFIAADYAPEGEVVLVTGSRDQAGMGRETRLKRQWHTSRSPSFIARGFCACFRTG